MPGSATTSAMVCACSPRCVRACLQPRRVQRACSVRARLLLQPGEESSTAMRPISSQQQHGRTQEGTYNHCHATISDEMRPEGDKYAQPRAQAQAGLVSYRPLGQLGLKCRSERCWSERERAANSVHDEAMSASSSSSRCRRLPAPVLQLLQPPAGEAAAAAGGGQPKGRNGRSN